MERIELLQYAKICLIECLTVLLEYLDLFAIYIGGRAQQVFGRAWALPGLPMVTPLLASTTKQIIPRFQKALHTKVWHTFNKIIFDYEQLPSIHYFFLQQPTIFFVFFCPLEIYENYTNNVSVRFYS